MATAAAVEYERCCSRPDIQVYDCNSVCLSCGSGLSASTVLETDTPSVHDDLSDSSWDDISADTVPIKSVPERVKFFKYSSEALLQSDNDIRLIALHPGDFAEDIHCDVFSTSLLNFPIYEAISYTWADSSGGARFCKTITCGEQKRKLPVAANAGAALRRIRLPDRRRCVWMDSICINQWNSLERNHQVHLMADIYRNARQVLVYLGEEGDGSDKVVDRLPLSERNGIVSAMSDDILTSFNALLRRSWFKRVWVIQEVASAKQALVLCGAEIAPWARLLRAVGIESTNGQRPSVITLGVSQQAGRYNLLDLLNAARSCESTDPRDKVFALLSLVKGEATLGLSADYQKTAAEVFIEVAERLIIGTTPRLDVLRATDSAAKDPLLPSWVPDWSSAPRTTPLNNQCLASLVPISLSESLKAPGFQCLDNGKSLLARGRKISLVRGVECMLEDYKKHFFRGNLACPEIFKSAGFDTIHYKAFIYDLREWITDVPECCPHGHPYVTETTAVPILLDIRLLLRKGSGVY